MVHGIGDRSAASVWLVGGADIPFLQWHPPSGVGCRGRVRRAGYNTSGWGVLVATGVCTVLVWVVGRRPGKDGDA